ncbi:unnamed protein product [Rhizopus stolonifer]
MSETATKDTSEEKLAPVELTNKYDGTQLKNAVDDEISRFYGKNQQYIQSYKHTDIKLFLGYVSCFIAGGSFYYEYKTSFREAINVTTISVIVFWILQLLIIVYTYFVENNQIFKGTLNSQGEVIYIYKYIIQENRNLIVVYKSLLSH